MEGTVIPLAQPCRQKFKAAPTLRLDGFHRVLGRDGGHHHAGTWRACTGANGAPAQRKRNPSKKEINSRAGEYPGGLRGAVGPNAGRRPSFAFDVGGSAQETGT